MKQNMIDIHQEYNGGYLTCENHESYNDILDCKTLTEVEQYLKNNNYLFLGVTDNYDYKHDNITSAFVFKDRDDNVRWHHIPELWLVRISGGDLYTAWKDRREKQKRG